MRREDVLKFLEEISQHIGKENWQDNISNIVEQYIKETQDKKF